MREVARHWSPVPSTKPDIGMAGSEKLLVLCRRGWQQHGSCFFLLQGKLDKTKVSWSTGVSYLMCGHMAPITWNLIPLENHQDWP